LRCFRDIAVFLLLTLYLMVFPLDQIAYVGVSPSMNLHLCSREIIFEVFTVPERHRRTNSRTDRRHTVAQPSFAVKKEE